jgi:hypothetical protein
MLFTIFYQGLTCPSGCEVVFLTDTTNEEIEKIWSWVKYANQIINDYFGASSSFDVLICRGTWEMEVQLISRQYHQSRFSMRNDTKFVAITDYRLGEIVIRHDIARFGHYLHELIHGIINKHHPNQLREALAWYFTLKLTERYKYVRPSYPSWVDDLYVYPVNMLAKMVGEEFLKDLAIGKASVQHDLLPKAVQELFAPEEVFYSKKRYRK